MLLHQRNSLHYTVNEMLFYTNHNTNEIIPWQAESFSYNPDFTEITLKLRDGVTTLMRGPRPCPCGEVSQLQSTVCASSRPSSRTRTVCLLGLR